MRLETGIFFNIAPFENLRIDFCENINILSGFNGSGKTTILSFIADSFYELVKTTFEGSFENKARDLYRISSPLDRTDISKNSYVYLRFKNNDDILDYIYFNGNISENEYNSIIKIDNSIKYDDIKDNINEQGFTKFWKLKEDNKVRKICNNNVITYFPFYRFDYPSFINCKYKDDLVLNTEQRRNEKLINKIEVISDIKEIVNWIMDVVLDLVNYRQISSNLNFINKEEIIHNKINTIISKIIYPNDESLYRLGIGKRMGGLTRVSVVEGEYPNIKQIYPSIFKMSAGELSLLCIFAELIRQSDNIGRISENTNGIVIIDEIDKHLHIRLQKEVIPYLLLMFPNLQFIISSHSPFFYLGLQNVENLHYKIFDLNNNGVECSPEDAKVFEEGYNAIVGDSIKFRELYNEIKGHASESAILVITEGQSDWKHLDAARRHLSIKLENVEFYPLEKTLGDGELKKLLELFCKCNPFGNIIGMFDRDKDEIICDKDNNKKKLMNSGFFSLGESVYAFAIPIVNQDIYKDKISIEHYYSKNDLMREDKNGRRLFLGEEFYPKTGKGINNNCTCSLGKKLEHKVEVNGIIDSCVYLNDDPEGQFQKALSKDDFADLIMNDEEFSKNIDFSNFNKIFSIIKLITNEIETRKNMK